VCECVSVCFVCVFVFGCSVCVRVVWVGERWHVVHNQLPVVVKNSLRYLLSLSCRRCVSSSTCIVLYRACALFEFLLLLIGCAVNLMEIC
jgi:hypothetical protein